MYTKKDTEVWWSLHVYLLNFEDKHCGFSVSLIASEGGSNQAKTVFKNTFTRELDLEDGCEEMVIDTERTGGKPEYSAEATWYGEFHGWQDATNDVLNGNAHKVLCCNGEEVQIMLDGKGKDKDHVGVKGTITIPWIGY
jgi:hypothetical protein